MPDTKEIELWRLVDKAFQNSIEKFGDIFAKDVTRDLLANGVTVQKWISVKDRRPDTETDRWEDEDGSDYAYEISEWLWGIDVNGTQVRVRFESGPIFEGWYDGVGKVYVITHWMPLPQPPKGE